MSGKEGQNGVVAKPAFEVVVRGVAQNVRRSLVELFAAVGADPGRPQQVARQLGLDKNLAWKTCRVISDDDPLSALSRLPGRGGARILVESFERAGAPSVALGAVRSALGEFERMVKAHAGNRETLEMMLSSLTRDGHRDREETHRKMSFQGNSATWGVQARVQVSSHYVALNREEPSRLDFATVSGLVDFRRLRQDVPWAVASIRQYHDDGSDNTGDWQLGSLEGDSAEFDGAPVMREFSTSPLPPLRKRARRSATGQVVRYEIAEGPVGIAGSVTCLTGWYNRSHVEKYRTDLDRYGEHVAVLSTPVETVVHDLFVDRKMGFAIPPKAYLYSMLPGGPVYPDDGRERGLLDVAADVTDLGAGPPDVTLAEVGMYPRIYERVTERMGWKAEDFHGFRYKLKYPPIPTLVVFRYELPERGEG